MPRVKQTKPKRVDVGVTSVDAPTVTPDAAVFAPGQDAPAPAAGEAPVPVGPKKARVVKPRPCVRCEERRAREREYAKASRLRQRLATAPPPTPADAAEPSGDAVPQADPAPAAAAC